MADVVVDTEIDNFHYLYYVVTIRTQISIDISDFKRPHAGQI